MTYFKDVDETAYIEAKYAGKIIIILESLDDVDIFSKWFYDKTDKIVFQNPSNKSDLGGCSLVIKRVKEYREKGTIAYGIVDRDALHRENKNDELWEIDDKKFLKYRPFGEWVYVLLRWEIENYLLDPTILENYIADSKKDPPRQPRHIDDALKDFFSHCEALIPMATIIKYKNQVHPDLTNCIEDFVDQKFETQPHS